MLAEVPLVLMLAGLTAYAVLGGADFGAGMWTLGAGRGPRGVAIRDHAAHATAVVWEANHVWLIYVLVVCWTAYPVAFGSITSTLAVPLFLAAVGIIFRGTAYALRSPAAGRREQRAVGAVFGLSCLLTPFALGAVAGGIAAGKVPVGNASGDLWSSWLNTTSVAVGVIAVATAAYLAAVYLAADAARLGDDLLARSFRGRALAAGFVAGLAALAGLLVVRADDPRLWHGLSHGGGLVAAVVSAAAGLATLALVWLGRFEPARATAALAVAAVVAGWALAQRPTFLPGLTIGQAAAGHSTLIAVVVAVAIGAVVLLPSLALLFGLVLRGRFDPHAAPAGVLPEPRATAGRPTAGWIAAACAVAGVPLTFFGSSWALGVGVGLLLGFAAAAFPLLATPPGDEP